MKKILILGFLLCCIGGSVWLVRSRTVRGAEYELLQSDRAISKTKSWRMRIDSHVEHWGKEWMVIEAIPPDREHGWQHVDRPFGERPERRIANVEYIRIGEDRYFRGDAIWGHRAAPEWIKLAPRDMPPLDGFFELRLYLTNPRTGYSFDSVETSLRSQYYPPDMRLGELKTYSGHACREWSYDWEIRDDEGAGQLMHNHDTLCLGISDHLPYHLTKGEWDEVTYEWNPRISIAAPDPVLPRPKCFDIFVVCN